MRKTQKFITALGSLALISIIYSPAHAYIDPGTGSLIIQGIIGAIAAIGVTLKLYWHKLKVLFTGKKKSIEESKTSNEETNEH